MRKSKKKTPQQLKKEIMGLNPKEESFCQLYASDKEFFCNGTQSYIQAFDVTLYKGGKKPDDGKGTYMTYESVKEMAHRLLTRVDILNRINEIYESRGLNDTFVDKQLEKLITQDAEFPVKIKAIGEYNKLKGRITDKSTMVHTFVNDERSDEEVERVIEEQRKFFEKK